MLLIDEGGLVARFAPPSSDLRGCLAVAKDAESRLSFEGFPSGGGMLRLIRFAIDVFASIWGA